MYTQKELKELKATLAKVEKCSGECGKCGKWEFHSNGVYFAVGCSLAPNFSPIADTPKELKKCLIDQLKFEIEVVKNGLRHESCHEAD